ncbi:MAG: substrate-binding domain-containing protein [Opitutales bacterium]
MRGEVAIVMSEVFLRRLTPALIPFVRRKHDFRVVSIHRPIEELKPLLQEMAPAGLITEWLPEVTDGLLELELPTVIADTDYNYPGVVRVDVNDWKVGAEAAEALAQAGYRSFACLGNGTPYSEQRKQGFRRALGAGAGCSCYDEVAFKEARYSEYFSRPEAELLEWLRELPKPVGLFAVHDPLGRFACGICRELGLRVPEEVAVVGANNDPLVCGLSYPMLSSVSIPWDTIGAVVGDAMGRLLEGKPAPIAPILVPPGGVVARHSANYLAVEDPLLRRAMTYIEAHLVEDVTIGALCGELRVGRRSLERKFREYYGCTPWEMVCRLRIRRAKELLTQTNHPIAMVAEFAGFNDPERMATVFRRYAGDTPSSFRKANAAL